MAISTKFLINEVNLSAYMVGNYNFRPTTNGSNGLGNINLSFESPITPNFGDEISFVTNIDSDFEVFGGIITGKITNESDNQFELKVEGFAALTRFTTYTGRFRDSSVNGNMRDIIIAILTEKFPTWTYDINSIPLIDYDFESKTIDNEYINSIFDTFAATMNLQWWVDKNKKFYFKSRTFTTQDFTAEIGVNVTGRPLYDEDDSNFANIIKVFGKRFPVTAKQFLSGDGTPQSYELDVFPSAATQLEYTDGTNISATLEGTDNYDDPAYFDAYFKPAVPSIQFNVNTVSAADNIIVINQFTARIEEEIAYADSIAKYGFEKVETIDDTNIESQDEAYNIAKNYGDTYSDVIPIYSVPIAFTSQTDMENAFIGNSITFISDRVNDRFNVVEWLISGGSSNFLTIALRLNGTLQNSFYLLQDLLRKMNKRADGGTGSGNIITLYNYLGGNIYVELTNLSLYEQDTDDGTFVMQNAQLDNRSLMVEIASNCDDVATWTASNCSLTENTTTYYVDEGHAINIIKSTTATTLCYAQRVFPNGASSYEQTDLTDYKFSVLLYIKDQTALDKFNYAELRLIDSSTNYLYERILKANLAIGWNLVEIDTGSPEGSSGAYDLADIANYRLYLVTNNATDTFVSGDTIIDNAIYYTDDNTVTLADYPGIMREDFTTTEELVSVYNPFGIFKERFENAEFINTSNSTGTHDTTNDRYTLDAGEILYSELTYLDIYTVSSLLLSIDSDETLTDLKVEASFDEGVTWIEINLDTISNINAIVNSRPSPVFDAVFPWVFNADGLDAGTSITIRMTNNAATTIYINNYNIFYNLNT